MNSVGYANIRLRDLVKILIYGDLIGLKVEEKDINHCNARYFIRSLDIGNCIIKLHGNVLDITVYDEIKQLLVYRSPEFQLHLDGFFVTVSPFLGGTNDQELLWSEKGAWCEYIVGEVKKHITFLDQRIRDLRVQENREKYEQKEELIGHFNQLFLAK